MNSQVRSCMCIHAIGEAIFRPQRRLRRVFIVHLLFNERSSSGRLSFVVKLNFLSVLMEAVGCLP